MDAIPLQEEAALSQPPKAEAAVSQVRSADVCKQFVVGLRWPDHASPSSLRTKETPATMFVSFCRAAHRAVWLRPQSGAKDNFSAGAWRRHKLTRSATSCGVST